MRFRDLRIAERAEEDTKVPEIRMPTLNRKAKRALIAKERRKMGLGRPSPAFYWLPRPGNKARLERLEKARQETLRRARTKAQTLFGDTETHDRERNDDVGETADGVGPGVDQGQLA